eukprot:81652-Chlamydomonas_euryale.AAC.4
MADTSSTEKHPWSTERSSALNCITSSISCRLSKSAWSCIREWDAREAVGWKERDGGVSMGRTRADMCRGQEKGRTTHDFAYTEAL